MKTRVFTDEDKAVASPRGERAAIAAAILMVAMSSACIARQALAQAPVSDSISHVATEGTLLHVIVGHSIFLDTKTRLRRVYVADPTVLSSVTLSPNQIVVTAMTPGVSSLTLLDEMGQAQSYVVSSDVDVAGLRVAMSEAMRGSAVSVDGTGGHVVLSGTVGTDAMADAAVKLAGLYSKEVANALTVTATHPKQVRLQVRILEVDRSKALQMGVNLFNPGGNTSFLAGTTTSQYPSTMSYAQSAAGNIGGGIVTTANPLNFMLYSAKLNLGTTIQDLESKQVLQILAEPTITTISGEKADFLSGGEFPFPVIQPGGSGGVPVVTIQFRPYGVKLEFTPFVNEDGTIRLKVAPEVSALDYTNTITVSGFTIPALSTRRASTEVELRSDQSFAISGLLDQRTTDILSKNPGAASIPILGYLFKSKNVNHSTTELVVVITPTVVDPLSEMGVPSQPSLPISPLNTDKYDKALGPDRNPQPVVPAITPDHPPIVPPIFPPAAAVTPPAASKAASTKHAKNSPASPKSKQATAPAAASNPASNSPSQSLSAPNAVSPRPSAPPRAAVSDTVKAVVTPVSLAARFPQKTASDSPRLASNSNGSSAASVQKSTEGPMVEIMALSHEADADAMVAALKRHGYSVAVSHNSQDTLLHLEVGPFASKADAESMRQRLLFDGYNAAIK